MKKKIEEFFIQLQQAKAIEDISLEYILSYLGLDSSYIDTIDEVAESIGIEVRNQIYCNNNHLERIVGKNKSRYIDLLAHCDICEKSFIVRDEFIKKTYKLI